jgi:hypothetical protein
LKDCVHRPSIFIPLPPSPAHQNHTLAPYDCIVQVIPEIYYADTKITQRTLIMPPPPIRTTRAQANQEELNLKKAMGLSKALKKQAAPPKQTRRGRPRRRAASISSEESADGDVEEDSEGSDGGSEEEDQSDVEEPVSFAPAHVPTGHETGLLSLEFASELPAPLDDEMSLFDNMNSDDEDNDDVIYQRVEDISDFDDENEDERQDEDELAAQWEAEAEQDPAMILDQLDEESVYGFDADFDSGEEFVAFTSESDHPPEVEIRRRVHFSVEDTFPRLATESLSPVFRRTLMPTPPPADGISTKVKEPAVPVEIADTEADPDPDPDAEEDDPYDSTCVMDEYFHCLLTRSQLMPLVTIFLPRLLMPPRSFLFPLSTRSSLSLPLHLRLHLSGRRARSSRRRHHVSRDLVLALS